MHGQSIFRFAAPKCYKLLNQNASRCSRTASKHYTQLLRQLGEVAGYIRTLVIRSLLIRVSKRYKFLRGPCQGSLAHSVLEHSCCKPIFVLHCLIRMYVAPPIRKEGACTAAEVAWLWETTRVRAYLSRTLRSVRFACTNRGTSWKLCSSVVQWDLVRLIYAIKLERRQTACVDSVWSAYAWMLLVRTCTTAPSRHRRHRRGQENYEPALHLFKRITWFRGRHRCITEMNGKVRSGGAGESNGPLVLCQETYRDWEGPTSCRGTQHISSLDYTLFNYDYQCDDWCVKTICSSEQSALWPWKTIIEIAHQFPFVVH